MTKTRILVVEDNNELREDIIVMLTLEDYDAYGAENGLAGIRVAREKRPDLIVCDIMMPELDGFGMLERLREDAKTATIPFIFLTAKTERFVMRQGMVLGADDFVTKPFQVVELLDSIKAQLKKREDLNDIANKRVEEIRKSITTALPHELRTPLNTIIGFSDILLSEASRLKPDQVASWAEHINNAGHRLYRLIENYLFYAKFQVASENEVRFRASEPLLELASLVEAEAQRKAYAYGRTADLTVEIESAPDIYAIYEDALKVMTELIDNAFKFSEAGQAIRVQGKVVEDGYEVLISDCGVGMTEEQIASIGAFMQFDRDIHEQQGLGLGLAIVGAVALAYDFDFEVMSDFGVGSTMRFRFKTH